MTNNNNLTNRFKEFMKFDYFFFLSSAQEDIFTVVVEIIAGNSRKSLEISESAPAATTCSTLKVSRTEYLDVLLLESPQLGTSLHLVL